MNGYEKQVKDLLKQYGWQFLRHAKGSHDIWTDGKHSVSVNHVCRSKFTADSIMKRAGIKHKF